MTIEILINGEEKRQIALGTSLEEIALTYGKKEPLIVAAAVNNELRDLRYRINETSKIDFIDIAMELGHRIYVRSLSFLFIRAAKEVIPGANVLIEHSLSKGLYCEVEGQHLNGKMVKAMETRMQEIVDADEPIELEEISKEEALKIFKESGQLDKERMISYLPADCGKIYKTGWLYDFFYGYVVPRTSYVKLFSLQFHLPGVILRFPTTNEPLRIPQFISQPKLARVFYEAERWAEIMEVNTIADVNEAITDGSISRLISVAEALHEKKVANIADEIDREKDRGNVILIAGPTSSGKTTFADRLMIQLMVNGMKPVAISVDNYFVDREKTPKDEFGEYDFESIDAIDKELLNEHLTKLLQGEEINLPVFNFYKGTREYNGDRMKIRPDQPIIIEGIHGLNESLTYSIPKDHKYKIYISCLTQLNIDNHNRIPTTDIRKLRRIVRDHQFRGYGALDTLRLWPSVRRGEERYIFPYQEDADIMFNSSLIYEIAVLKQFAEPLLRGIEKSQPEYIEAQSMLRFLTYVTSLQPTTVPPNSILKEFIG